MAEFGIDHLVLASEKGRRLDLVIATHAECSRARAREILEGGWVEVDGRVARGMDKGMRLQEGQRVVVRITAADLDALVPDPDAPLHLLAQGEGWVAVDKPAGVAVHPLSAAERHTLLQRVAARFPEIEGVGEGGRRSGVVHRLDVDTSGVQLYATEEDAWQRLRAAFAGHRVDKVYRAVVAGVPDEYGQVEFDLVVAAHRPARVRAYPVGEGGVKARRCALRWRRLRAGREASLVEVRPRSGFLHQIRASFSALGHPLVGDSAYGGPPKAARHLLHASRVAFEEIEAESEDPDDLRGAIASLGDG